MSVTILSEFWRFRKGSPKKKRRSAKKRNGNRWVELMSAPNSPPTGSCPRGFASQPLFQPPGTAFGKALVSPCLSQAPPPLPEYPPLFCSLKQPVSGEGCPWHGLSTRPAAAGWDHMCLFPLVFC